MLDTRTTIRNFRDLQFDLRCILDGIHSLENGSSVVELKWSDGSVDKVPSYELVQAYVQNAFNTIGLGNNQVSSNNGIALDGKLSAKILSVIDTALTFRNCKIGSIKADIVKLGNLVKVSAIEHSGIIDTNVTTVTNPSKIDKFYSAVLSASTLDHSKGVHYVEHVHLNTSSIPLDSYLTNLMSGQFKPLLVVDGYIKTYSDIVQVRTYEKLYVYAPYVINGASSEKQAGIYNIENGEYPRLSVVNLSLLYPYKSFGRVSNTYASLTFNTPRDEDQYKVVTIRNTAPNGLRACNVWSFCHETNGQNSVRIVPGNYINIPPYSAIDFIFTFTYTNDALYVYMLPTKALP